MKTIEFEKIVEYKFKDLNILELALTHGSCNVEKKRMHMDNERLEFIGDAFLDAIVGAELYNNLPTFSEGKLTKMRALCVCEAALADIARSLRIGAYINLGPGEESHGGREKDSILADCLEAIIGAIFIDGGYIEAERFVLRTFKSTIDLAIHGKLFSDYKSEIQEIIQSKVKNPEIKYVVDSETGPAHERVFNVHIEINGVEAGRGSGRTKKEAEQLSAKAALDSIKEKK